MAKAKRHYHHHEHLLYKRLKLTIMAIVLIPLSVIALFVFFGPLIGSIFGIVSVNRNVDINSDVVPPAPPIFDNPPQATNSQSIGLKGFAEEGTTIKLFVNGPEQQTTVTTTDGTFNFENVELINGRNTLFTRAIDSRGNESEKSPTIAITVDMEGPKIELEEPKDGDFIRNLNDRVVLKGKISEKAEVKINDKLAVLRPDYTFEFPLGVQPGEVEIKIKATDAAGNSTEEDLKITYIRSSPTN